LPRYGHTKSIINVLSDDSGKDSYAQGWVEAQHSFIFSRFSHLLLTMNICFFTSSSFYQHHHIFVCTPNHLSCMVPDSNLSQTLHIRLGLWIPCKSSRAAAHIYSRQAR
jgi:hypothetical protein